MHLIHNPTAGRGRSIDVAEKVSRTLARAGVHATIWTTTRRREATDIARDLPRDATVVAIGGDGTVNEVAAACIGTERTLGIVPAGSGDDFAHALGLRRWGTKAAIAALLAGKTARVDTGLVDGDIPFVNGMGMGFDADVGARKDDAPPHLKGLGAYGWAVATCLRDLENVEALVSIEGVLVFEGPSLLVSCMNGRRTGGSFPFAPHAALDDGALDVVLAMGLSRRDTVRLLPRVMVGRHLSHSAVRAHRGASVHLSWARPRALHVDGEIVRGRSNVEITSIPASLRVIVP